MHESILLGTNPHAVAIARGFVRDTLTQWNLAVNVDDAELIASELATNAIRYGDPPVTIHVRSEAEKVCIEMVDCGTVEPDQQLTPPPDSAASGRGLIIVAALSQSWGVHSLAHGKGVWAQLSA